MKKVFYTVVLQSLPFLQRPIRRRAAPLPVIDLDRPKHFFQRDHLSQPFLAALVQHLRQRPLDQLRVRELTERCGLRRQSFYYHFKDVYA